MSQNISVHLLLCGYLEANDRGNSKFIIPPQATVSVAKTIRHQAIPLARADQREREGEIIYLVSNGN